MFSRLSVVNTNGFNPLSVNPTKWSNTLKQQSTDCLSKFDHFVGLTRKGLGHTLNIFLSHETELFSAHVTQDSLTFRQQNQCLF